MIQSGFGNIVAATTAPRRSVSVDSLGRGLWAGLSHFRPADGWATIILLALNLMVVVWSVEQADWAPTPNLVFLILAAMFTGLVLYRIPWWGLAVLPLGLLAGLGVIVWQLTSFQSEGMELANAGELWHRLNLWRIAAQTGNINIDRVPFVFALMSLTWLSGYLAAWVFFRHRNFWGVFVLGGAGLLSNLTFMPSEGSVYLGIYLLTALLLVARVQAVRRRDEWRRKGFQFDSHLGILSVSDSVVMAFIVLLVAFLLLPTGGFWRPTHNVYEYMRSPLLGWQEDFNRLFAGLPARRPMPYRVWGDVKAFQGTINPTTTPVLRVDSPVPMYWKARSYGTYTSLGWMSEGTTLQPPDWTPSHARPSPYLKRFTVTHTLTPSYRTRNLFAGGQVISASRDLNLETYDSPVYTLDLTRPISESSYYPQLNWAAINLEQALQIVGPNPRSDELAPFVPREFELVDVIRGDNRVRQVRLAEVLPQDPDFLALRSSDKELKPGETYQVTSSVSLATPEDLRLAGLDYPTWALAKYTQLPPDLPQRVRHLGDALTVNAETPYDKAKAIENYLKTLTYSLSIKAPPYDADGVDYFLFEQQQGYSEYFASAMTVLLRTQGVPARMVTGYSVGAKVPDEDIYIVADSNSHGWVEVYFPRYGWIGFEPTPGVAFPVATRPAVTESDQEFDLSNLNLDFPVCDIADEEECEEDFMQEEIGSLSLEPLTTRLLRQLLPWLVGFLAAALVSSGAAWLFWRRCLVSSADPETAFQRLIFLGRLNAISPEKYHTPYQYLSRLQGELPRHREQLHVVVNRYVLSLYGQKEGTLEENNRLIRAWEELRFPLLFHLLRRRSYRNEPV